jgi:hypothetical protein
MRTGEECAADGGGSGFDLTPVRIETADGRRVYQREQAALAARAQPVRRRVLAEYERCVAVWDAQDADQAAPLAREAADGGARG